MSKKINPFHLAIPVNNLSECRKFYDEVLQCDEGRSDTKWVDFDLYGHQLVIHEVEDQDQQPDDTNPVDGHAVPVPHFGVVLDWDDWHQLADRLKDLGIEFIIEPYIRFEDLPGEQATLFFKDPSGNALEFKSFKDMSQLFAK
ncbi:MAG: VOC family protein [Cyclobacteriaceae bacterium]